MQNAAFQRDRDGFDATSGFQFGQQIIHVQLDRAFGNGQRRCDLFIAFPFTEQLEHLSLSL